MGRARDFQRIGHIAKSGAGAQEVEVLKDKADVFFDINYTGIIEGSNERKIFSGIGDFKLKCEYDYWCISKINVLGISI